MARILLHVAYGKAGSSFILRWFEDHPDFSLITSDEIVSFMSKTSGGIVNFGSKNLGRYPKYFVMSDERLGSLLPRKILRSEYYEDFDIKRYHYDVCKILKGIFRESKVMIVTRNYKDYFRSNYSQYIKGGGDLAFQDYLTKFRHLFEELLDFNYLIELYASTFGKQEMIVMPYELLRDDIDFFFSFIENKLGLKQFRVANIKVNSSLNSGELSYYRAMSKVAASITEKLKQPYSTKLYENYIRSIRSRYHPWAKLLRYFTNKGKNSLNCPSEYYFAFRGKGSILKNNLLYANYKTEYLLDD